jgi:hypothetical protein
MGKQTSAPSSAGWHGAPRKRRKKRLQLSDAVAPDTWSPTKADWDKLEKAYGKTFNKDLRAEIETAVQEYFSWAPFEEAAPFANDFIQKLVKARKLAKELGKVVHSFGGAGSMVARHWEQFFPREDEEHLPDGPADEDDKALFDRILAMPSRRGRNHRDFSQVVHTIFSALGDALRDVTRENSAAFSEGDAWEKLVIDLARAFRSRGLGRATATKDRDRPLSPFVRFVKELQATFKDETLRRHPTPAGLSGAISQALSLLKARERREKRCVSAADLRAVQAAIAAGRWRQNSQSKDWAGYAVASALKLDANDKAARSKIRELLKTWIKNGMFVVVEGLDNKRERRSYVEVGDPRHD